MRRIEVKQLDYDLTPVGGLALVGHYLKVLAPQWAKLDGALPGEPTHGDERQRIALVAAWRLKRNRQRDQHQTPQVREPVRDQML